MRSVGRVLVEWQNGWPFFVMPLVFLCCVSLPALLTGGFVWWLGGLLAPGDQLPLWPFLSVAFVLMTPFWARHMWPSFRDMDVNHWNT